MFHAKTGAKIEQEATLRYLAKLQSLSPRPPRAVHLISDATRFGRQEFLGFQACFDGKLCVPLPQVSKENMSLKIVWFRGY